MNPPQDTPDQDIDEILTFLVHTYIAKITKPRNNTELEAYNEKVDKLLEVAKAKLTALLQRVEKEATVGWTLEAPDLPYFQITFTNRNNTPFNNSDDYANWTSPIFDTKNLPLVIKELKSQGDIK